MPVRNSIADRIDETRIILKTALIRNNKMAKDVEKRKIMNANTFYVKQAKTDRLKLSDLWRLDDMLHFTDEEILKMFGREREWLNWLEQLTATGICVRSAGNIQVVAGTVLWEKKRTLWTHIVQDWLNQEVGRMKK